MRTRKEEPQETKETATHRDLFDDDVLPDQDPTIEQYLDPAQKDVNDHTPKAVHRTDDSIYHEACEMLTRHPAIDATDIEVKVENGTIQLAGSVPDRQMKYLTEDLLEEVWGIEGIENRMKVVKGR